MRLEVSRVGLVARHIKVKIRLKSIVGLILTDHLGRTPRHHGVTVESPALNRVPGQTAVGPFIGNWGDISDTSLEFS